MKVVCLCVYVCIVHAICSSYNAVHTFPTEAEGDSGIWTPALNLITFTTISIHKMQQKWDYMTPKASSYKMIDVST